MSVNASSLSSVGKAKSIPRKELRSKEVVEAELRELRSKRVQFQQLNDEHYRLYGEAETAGNRLASLQAARENLDHEFPVLTGEVKNRRDQLSSDIEAVQAKIVILDSELAGVRQKKADYQKFEEFFPQKEAELQGEIESFDKKDKVKETPVAAASVAAPETPVREQPAPQAAVVTPRPKGQDLTDGQLRSELQDELGFTAAETALLMEKRSDAERVYDGQISAETYRKMHPGFAEKAAARTNGGPAPAVSSTPVVVRTSNRERFSEWNSDHPTLVPFLALVAVILLFWLAFSVGLLPRFWEQTTTSTPIPTAQTSLAPTTAPAAAPAFSEPVETYGLDRTHNRVIARSNVPTTARLIEITPEDKVVATDASLSQRHNLDWTVPDVQQPTTFNLKVELKDAQGRTSVSGQIVVEVLPNSMAAGGQQKPADIIAMLQYQGNQAYWDGYVDALRAIAAQYPDSREAGSVTRDNLISFLQQHQGDLAVTATTEPMSGDFAFVLPNGTIGYNRVALPAGTRIQTYKGHLLASAMCGNVVKQPVPVKTATPRPATPTPVPTRTPTPTSPPCCVFVPTPTPAPTPTKNPQNFVTPFPSPSGVITPPPTATPLPISYTVVVRETGLTTCQTAYGPQSCWIVRWSASNVTPTASNGWVAWGPVGYNTRTDERGTPDGQGNWVAYLYPLPSGKTFQFQAYTSVPGGQAVASGVFTFTAP